MKRIIIFLLLSVALLGAGINPASKVYIADVEGNASVFTTEGKIEDAERRKVYSAEGLVFETKEKSNQSMVLSNGVGVYIHHETLLEIKRFMQEPFTPNRIDLEVEPSISQTRGFIPHGYVAICTSKIVAGSTMTYESRHGRVSIQSIGKVAINVLSDKTEVIAVEGDFGIKIGYQDFGRIKTGEKATMNGKDVIVQKADKKEFEFAVESVVIACNARKLVLFEMMNQAGVQTKEIVAMPLLPTHLPTEFTVSPARLP